MDQQLTTPTFESIVRAELAAMQITPERPTTLDEDYRERHKAELRFIAEKVAELPSITDEKTYERNKAARNRLVKLRTGIDARRKQLFDPIANLKREVDAYLGTNKDSGLQAEVAKFEAVIRAKEEAWEQEQERIRQEAQRIIDERNAARAKRLQEHGMAFNAASGAYQMEDLVVWPVDVKTMTDDLFDMLVRDKVEPKAKAIAERKAREEEEARLAFEAEQRRREEEERQRKEQEEKLAAMRARVTVMLIKQMEDAGWQRDGDDMAIAGHPDAGTQRVNTLYDLDEAQMAHLLSLPEHHRQKAAEAADRLLNLRIDTMLRENPHMSVIMDRTEALVKVLSSHDDGEFGCGFEHWPMTEVSMASDAEWEETKAAMVAAAAPPLSVTHMSEPVKALIATKDEDAAADCAMAASSGIEEHPDEKLVRETHEVLDGYAYDRQRMQTMAAALEVIQANCVELRTETKSFMAAKTYGLVETRLKDCIANLRGTAAKDL